jgi:hypothetical protein
MSRVKFPYKRARLSYVLAKVAGLEADSQFFLIKLLSNFWLFKISGYLCHPKTKKLFYFYKDLNCPGGEIGRRTVFRSQRSQGCAGSNPVLGTN